MVGYAYLDKYQILHVVSSKKTAKEYCAFGSVVSTKLPYKGGYLDESLCDRTDYVCLCIACEFRIISCKWWVLIISILLILNVINIYFIHI